MLAFLLLLATAQARSCLTQPAGALTPKYQCGVNYQFCTDLLHGDSLVLTELSTGRNFNLEKAEDSSVKSVFQGDHPFVLTIGAEAQLHDTGTGVIYPCEPVR